MTVNGKEVPRSEFEYLYNKNNHQQMSPQPLEDYVEMFKIYKLKVEDAKSMGIDTTANFLKEMTQYRRELASPYIADTEFVNKLEEDGYGRMLEEVEVSFIKIPKSKNPLENIKIKSTADSIANVLKNGGDFSEAAQKHSIDIAAQQGGYHGFMTAGRLPFSFEEALYNTPSGTVSDVVELSDSYYILKPGKRRPSRGKVEVAHILKLVPQNADQSVELAAKQQIDSLYNLVKADPEKFGDIAKINSDDKASARNEGKLPAFASGDMVPEFDEVSFSLQEGEISEPFKSKFGWHIVKKINNVANMSKEDYKKDFGQKINNPQDQRFRIVKENEIKKLIKKHNGTLDEKQLNEMKRQASVAGLDSLYLANWTTMPTSQTKVGQVGKKVITAGDVLEPIKKLKDVPAEVAPLLIEQSAERALGNYAMNEEEDWLYLNEPDYRNLVDEYNDGSLLYEVSLIKVWDKAPKDVEGAQKFFSLHKDKYKWAKPKVKGILVQATNDSVANEIRNSLDNMKTDNKTLLDVKKEFVGKTSIEEVIVEEGVNPMVDNIMFGGPAVKPKNVNYTTYFLYEPKILTAPEEFSDVKAEVLADYQEELEREWIKEMEEKYPVVIYYDEIAKIK